MFRILLTLDGQLRYFSHAVRNRVKPKRDNNHEWLSVRLTKEQWRKLHTIAREIAPDGTKPSVTMATRYLIEQEKP